jgi:hypothetical protein
MWNRRSGLEAAQESKAAEATQQAQDITTGRETGLEISGSLGAGLIAAAQEANRVAMQSAAIGKVQELMTQLRKQRDYRQNADENIALLERKLAAVERGEIKVSPYGQITFLDAALQKATIGMAECVNCGYSRTRTDPRD